MGIETKATGRGNTIKKRRLFLLDTFQITMIDSPRLDDVEVHKK